MQIPIDKELKLLQKRKLYVKSVVILMVLLLLLFNGGSWLFFNKMEHYLESELGKRLAILARLSARNIENTLELSIDDVALISDSTSSEFLLIQSKLRSLQTNYELEGVYLISRQSRVIIDGSGNFSPGTQLTHIQQDSLQIFQAWTGQVAVSPIHLVEGNRFKNAYAPITNIWAEVSALLVLEANAEFFEVINIFKRGLIVGGLASLAAIVLFALFLGWSINLLISTQESLRKSEKLALLGQMSAGVAHEIRNPLGVIKATADVLKIKYENKEQPDELFDYIGTEVNRLNNLVSDFLSFAREIKLNYREADIVTTVRRAVIGFEREFQEKNIAITLNVNNETEKFNFDEEKIQQVLFNLLGNAGQAIENGGEIVVQIDTFRRKGKNYVEIAVQDSGKGIEGEIEKIFEPFYTTKSSGSGLGLAITKQIVEKHGGWIEVESEKNVGTTVKFYLPKN